jgi:hypothetical protein
MRFRNSGRLLGDTAKRELVSHRPIGTTSANAITASATTIA